MRYFHLGKLAGTTMDRWAVLKHGTTHTVKEILVSLPDGEQVPRPHGRLTFADEIVEATVKQYLFNNPMPLAKNAGEQPRRTVWRRTGKRVAAVE